MFVLVLEQYIRIHICVFIDGCNILNGQVDILRNKINNKIKDFIINFTN